MTIANDLIKLALRNSGVNGVGQTPLAEDTNDGLTLLNDMIKQWQLQRTVLVIPGTLDLFPDLTTNVTSWTPNENVLLTTLMVRLRQAYFLPPDETLNAIATTALQTFQSNAKQWQPAPTGTTIDTTGKGVIFLALRAAGRINDLQGSAAASQDVTDAFLLLTEMISEWNLDRTVAVIPGTIPTYPDLTTTVTQTAGINSAIMWNLAVRIRSAFGLDDNKVQADQAAKALSLVQANNRQQEVAPGLSVDDLTGFGLVFLALRASGRVTDIQGVTQTSQDMTDGISMLQEMLDEWRLERTVRVIPGTLPVITNFASAIAFAPGVSNAIMLNLAQRMRDTYGLPENKTQAAAAAKALELLQANNRQQQPPVGPAATDGTGNGLVLLALRAAGRVNDDQAVSLTSQDVTDTQSMLNEMLDEWQRERTVRVIPGTLAPITDFTAALSMSAGEKNAVVLNLACRLRDAFGAEVSKTLAERADKALALLQANNRQQQPAVGLAADDGTGNGLVFLALRAAGRVNDDQAVSLTSQDVTDTQSMLNEMLDEWQRERAVRVIPGTLAQIADFTTTLTMTSGEKNAVVLNLACRLRDAFGVEVSKTLVERADRALQLLQAINLQQNPALTLAADDGSGYGVLFLALRAAGRVNDEQGVVSTSQDVTDATSLMREMLDEWQRERSVRVIPGTLPTVPVDLTLPWTLTTGVRNAIVLNLAVRLRDAFGAEVNKSLIERADRALALLQAINLQQNPAITIAADDGTGFGLLFLALRAAGRVIDTQGVTQTSQDMTDAHSLLNEMLDEWQTERAVRVIPGTLDAITDLSLPLVMSSGEKSAVMLNLACRLRDAFGAEVSKTLADRADHALQLLQANNLQQIAATAIAADDGTGQGIIFLALRAAGRVNDQQGVLLTSQDMTDAASLLSEMLDEWQRERTVRVIPGSVTLIADLTVPVTLLPGERNAIVLGLAVRLRDAFGAELSPALVARADKALALLQANNRQQQPAVGAAADDSTGNGLVFLALRAAGRVNDDQAVSLTSQDVTDTQSLLTEMLDEWRLERTVRVIPGTLPVINDFTLPVSTTVGVKNAIVLNLAIRIRDAFGMPENKSQAERATRALSLIQANNLQQVAPLHGGLPTTCQQVIFLALRAAGRLDDNQSVSDTGADVDAAFSLLNGMVSQWQRRRWLVPSLVDTWTVSTGAQSYTVTPGGDFDIPRPDRIESAFVRFGTINSPLKYALGILTNAPPADGGLWNNGGVLSFVSGVSAPAWAMALPASPPASGGYWNDGGVISDIHGPIVVSGWPAMLPADPNTLTAGAPPDAGFWDDGGVVGVIPGAFDTPPPIVSSNAFDYPLNIIQSREDYNKIGLKGLSTWVGSVFYDSAFPVGRLFFTAGVPISGLFELHIATKATIGGYATSADALNLPPEYIEALTTNLPLRIMALNPKGPQPTSIQLGLARAALQTIRTANAQISILDMPAEFMQGRRRGGIAASASPSFLTGMW